jgi:glycosyltransferase involved in cell wall biosynthesis
MKLSVVVPVYREAENISEFLQRTTPVLERITADYEIIFALDPSPDTSREVIEKAHQTNPRIKLLEFSRRFGQPMATLAGLQYSSGDAVVVMDVDLQDPPDLMIEMVSKWKEGYDVVYAQRRTRSGEPWVKRLTAYLGYKLIQKIVSDVQMPTNTGDYRLMSRRVVNEVLKLKESHGYLRGMVALVGFRQTAVQFDRPPRYSGKTNYNEFVGSLRIGINGVVCFSNYLLSMTTLLGFTIAGLSILLAIFYAVMKLKHFPFPMGNPTTVILILFIGAIQLISVGILGEYIGRIYDEIKHRPRYIVDRKVGFEFKD